MTILIVGSGAREHAIVKAAAASRHTPRIVCFGSHTNPGIQNLASAYTTGSLADAAHVANFAKFEKCDIAFIGPEAPLAAGVADALTANGIACIGPKKMLAQIETSKGLARDLLSSYRMPGLPKYSRFQSWEGVEDFILSLGAEYVVKADGLMGGKGVKVFGEHLRSMDDTRAYCQTLCRLGESFIVEEKFVGQEFSLMTFTDGFATAHMPPVQDYKRAFDNDQGPNTGGMGCISNADHLLPFLSMQDIEEACAINEQTIRILYKTYGIPYIGILYGGFMATGDGVKLIEYNARFGDPESISVLSLLQSDFLDLCLAMAHTTLSTYPISFEHSATVCKYAVPNGYPDNPVKNETIDISRLPASANIYYGAVEERNGALIETGSRAIAVVAKAADIPTAARIVEAQLELIGGPLYHRKDIGTQEMLNARVPPRSALRV